MFSGIVEETGVLEHLVERPGGTTLSIRAKTVLEGIKIGDSIAINGACLTVVKFDAERFDVELAPETLRKTSLQALQTDDPVNLERSLSVNGRLGGHFVQGHVDSTAEIIALEADGEGVMTTFRAPISLMKYIVPKGYVAIDGMSLTVVDTGTDWFTVSFISHTRTITIAQHYRLGKQVNLEVDILGKYVEKLMASRCVPEPPRAC